MREIEAHAYPCIRKTVAASLWFHGLAPGTPTLSWHNVVVKAWFYRLASWQFVLVVAGCFLSGFIAMAWVSTLGTRHPNLHSLIFFVVTFTVILTFVTTWKRWR